MIDRLLRFRCRCENCAVVAAKYLQPRRDIGGMVWAWFVGKSEIGAMALNLLNCATTFNDKLFKILF